ncbi:hypothetical protein QC764_0049410 [Podospora pseudoanserina]|uniref:Uncharacterized protein n=1 Tax=Podospora pseudoanserina TaxID=2609844 RepID=A0ABR0IBV8_9PEZI|nr:hypothetical protein QC764_0049410 [Podospora pseudoanserina]
MVLFEHLGSNITTHTLANPKLVTGKARSKPPMAHPTHHHMQHETATSMQSLLAIRRRFASHQHSFYRC